MSLLLYILFAFELERHDVSPWWLVLIVPVAILAEKLVDSVLDGLRDGWRN